jgi:hypothetical protein
MERNMRLKSKFGFAAGAILVTALGFTGQAKAAPLAGLTASVPAVQMTQAPSVAEPLLDKAYYHRRYYRRPYYHRPYYHRPYYHRRYYRRRY